MAVRQQHDRNQAAWERTPESRPGYRPPRPLPRQMRPAQERLHDPNQGVRDQAATQFRAERDVQQSVGRAEGQALGGNTGLAERNQVEEFGRGAMEMTGAPSWARGIQELQYGRPGEAIPEFGMAALNTAGLATLPYGAGARVPPPPRVPRGNWEPAYRGMTQPFDGEFRSYQQGWYGDTLSASRSPDDASFYARRNTGSSFGEGANVMPLEVRGPFVPQSVQEEIVRRQMRHTNPGRRVWLNQHTQPIVERVNNELRRRGYAGIETSVDNEIALFPDQGGGFSNVRSRFDEPPPRVPRAPAASAPAQGESRTWSIRTASTPGSPHVLEAVDQNGRVVGALDVAHAEGPFAEGSGPYARGVFVEPDFRRQGVATDLYREAERRFGRMVPSEAQNDSARAFWESYRPSRAGGPAQNLDDGAMTALRRELRDHEFDVPATMPPLPEIEVPVGSLRQGQIGALDRADARRYASMSTEAPPILVRRDRNGWHIIDGNRRAAAAQMRGDGTVRAIDASDLFTARTAPDGGPVQTGRRASEATAQGNSVDLSAAGGGIFNRLSSADQSTLNGSGSYRVSLPEARVRLRDLPEVTADMAGNEVTVGRYARQLRESEAPAIVVARDADGNWQILDGHTRTRAARRAGRQDIAVLDATDLIARSNRGEGLPRTGPNAGPPRPPPIFPGPRNR